jgi:hypothetical protein
MRSRRSTGPMTAEHYKVLASEVERAIKEAESG